MLYKYTSTQEGFLLIGVSLVHIRLTCQHSYSKIKDYFWIEKLVAEINEGYIVKVSSKKK